MRTADGIPLPEGWKEHRSPSRGIYFEHEPTGVTQWDFPRGPPSSKQVAEDHQRRVGRQVAELHPGAQIILTGLKFQPHLNGKTGTCEGWEPDGKMVRVRLQSRELKAVKPENLKVTQAAAARVQPQRLIEGKAEDTGGAGGLWASRNQVLGILGVGAIAMWFVRFALFLADEAAKKAAAERAALEGPSEEASAVAVAVVALPPGWCERVDPATGKCYFWRADNPVGTTTWVRPKAPAVTTSSPSQ